MAIHPQADRIRRYFEVNGVDPHRVPAGVRWYESKNNLIYEEFLFSETGSVALAGDGRPKLLDKSTPLLVPFGAIV